MDALFVPDPSGVRTLLTSPWTLLVLWLTLINLTAFFQMGLDKRRAKQEGKRRIPERTLFLTAILGGSLGAILGMRLFHHKTKHWYFVWGMPLILLAQLALGIWTWYTFFF